ncbi:T6SS phospholipase effector Tle1-like catalytic domain-containing protein [Flavobacterium sp. 2]|uniref:T6SS phospholipase effector Tle1-like catalytic domain-containing protein n=1 Tax=Flavobacterium sp. 2 TaxID=308053 RepID=UPI003CFA14D9
MSKTTIVEGKLTITATGNIEIHATNGDLNIHAAKHNIWHGEENGIFYHDYEPLHPADSLANEIDITLNIFFDGTQNNKTNTEVGKDHETSNHEDDSYTNDYSNIARGYDSIDTTVFNQVSVYIEGIATEDLKKDDIVPDVAMGIGSRGIVAKVTKACVEAGKKFKQKKYRDKKIDEIKVNVFGFSRGAAAARHFLHVANSPAKLQLIDREHAYAVPPFESDTNPDYIKIKRDEPLVHAHGYFAACLLNNDIKPKKIKFNFVGLYDTVSSHGVYHGNDVKDLHLDGVEKAHFVFQLAANDEYRENFDLTDITSAGINGLEYTLPGVHSDIGGSYKDRAFETAILYYKKESLYNEMIHNSKEEVAKFKEIVIKEGWYKDYQIKAGVFPQSFINTKKEKEKFEHMEDTYYSVIGSRKMRNTYDKIPLKKMFFYSKQFGVIYDDILSKKLHEIEDPFLQNVYNQLLNYMVACNDLRNSYVKQNSWDSEKYLAELRQISYLDYIDFEDLKTLRNEYLHWSVKANQFGLGSRESQAPSKEGALEQQYRKREIHHG